MFTTAVLIVVSAVLEPLAGSERSALRFPAALADFRPVGSPRLAKGGARIESPRKGEDWKGFELDGETSLDVAAEAVIDLRRSRFASSPRSRPSIHLRLEFTKGGSIWVVLAGFDPAARSLYSLDKAVDVPAGASALALTVVRRGAKAAAYGTIDGEPPRSLGGADMAAEWGAPDARLTKVGLFSMVEGPPSGRDEYAVRSLRVWACPENGGCGPAEPAAGAAP